MSASKPFFRRYIWPTLAMVAIAGGSLVATEAIEGAHGRLQAATAEVQTAKPTTPVSPAAIAPANELSLAFRTVHNAVEPAVVNISTTRTIKTQGGMEQIPEQMRKMFPPGMLPDQGGNAPETERMEGTGSGVIVSPDGYILTNNHVVEGADTITVRLNDDRDFKATVVGRDPKTDLAVVRIKATGLTYAKFGDSDAIQIGDWVLAFGSPFGFDHTMTQGIISAKGRTHVDIIGANNPQLRGLTYEDFLQTDAAINPGNSGGPLVNLAGEVVGIDSAIASRTGAYNGIGFAIPSNEAQQIMKSLIQYGKVVRGYLGVEISDIHEGQTPKVAQSLGYTGKDGVLVQGFAPGNSPGEQGGLKRGDIITQFDGKPIRTITELRMEVADTAPGTKVKLQVFRNGDFKNVDFAVGTQPDTSIAAAGPAAQSDQGSADDSTFKSSDMGLSVSDVTADVAQQLHLKEGHGVVVTNVASDGLAADIGLQRGDVIIDVQGTPVNTVAEFKAEVAKQTLAKGIRMSIESPGSGDRFVFLQRQ